MSIYAVVNPASANGRTGHRWPELASALRARLGEFEVAFTDAPRQATEITRRALRDGATTIVSVGGDGTQNEVINGFFAGDEPISPAAELAVIPAGTGGDLRRTLGLPVDPLAAIEQLGRRKRRVDVGHLAYTSPLGKTESSYFINIASFGLAGLTDEVVNNSSKALGAKASFLLGALRATVRYRNRPVRLRLDDGEPFERTLSNGVVANARYFGGGMKIAPGAEMADGQFDVVLVGDIGMFQLMRGLGRIYKGTHLDDPKIEVMRARTVHAEPVEAGDVVLIDMDGEQPGRLPATFSIRPAAVVVHLGEAAEIADA